MSCACACARARTHQCWGTVCFAQPTHISCFFPVNMSTNCLPRMLDVVNCNRVVNKSIAACWAVHRTARFHRTHPVPCSTPFSTRQGATPMSSTKCTLISFGMCAHGRVGDCLADQLLSVFTTPHYPNTNRCGRDTHTFCRRSIQQNPQESLCSGIQRRVWHGHPY